MFLNFDGATIIRGSDDPEKNQSWIPDYPEVEIPPFNHEPFTRAPLSSRQQVIDAVTGLVRHFYSPFNVIITSKRPPPGTDYAMMMIGGTGSLISRSPGAMVGVSPFDCGNTNKRDVAYTFSDSLGNLEDIVTTIVHEAGHGFGLAHVSNTKAIMNPYVTSDPDWAEGNVPDGSACDGTRFQNCANVLAANLGSRVDAETPWVDFLTPGDGARIKPPFTVNIVTGDEDSLGRWVELFLDGTSLGEKKWPYFTWQVSIVDAGRRELRARVRDRAGNTSSTTIHVTVDPECEAKGKCTPGRSGVSQICSSQDSCHLGLCVQDIDTKDAWCSAPCSLNTSACAPGMNCVLDQNEQNFYCAYGFGPVMAKSRAYDHRLGCSTSPGHHSSRALPFLAAFALLLLRRRQKLPSLPQN